MSKTSNVVIHVEDAPNGGGDESKGNGNIRRDPSFRRVGSRRSRSIPVGEMSTTIEEAPINHKVRKLRSMENIIKIFTGGSRRSHQAKEHEPGLRSMLYGLHQKLEREEAAMKKRQKKNATGKADDDVPPSKSAPPVLVIIVSDVVELEVRTARESLKALKLGQNLFKMNPK
ncbi:hypothetical protein Q1695_013351 [Nippostrongylus brasiliensis]|nr:hypothetical protein Q1695_013351 [Nippostrongylus brasiliensis]